VLSYSWEEKKKEVQVEGLRGKHTPSFKARVALEAIKACLE